MGGQGGGQAGAAFRAVEQRPTMLVSERAYEPLKQGKSADFWQVGGEHRSR